MISLLLEASVRISVIAVAVWMLLVVLRVRSGAVCHAAWASVLVAMLISPLMVLWRPELPVELPAVPPLALIELWSEADAEEPVPTVSALAATRASTPLAFPETAGSGGRIGRDTVASRQRDTALKWLIPIVWAVGSAVLLAQLFVGWRMARRLALNSTPIDTSTWPLPVAVPVSQSDVVAAPVTIGLSRPRVILPAAWTSWSHETLRTVVIHEAAHVSRRDTLVSFIARLNRCAFWWHPVSWIVERRLATTGEEACDDLVVRQKVGTQPYAEVLVTMADAVRVHGGRVAWMGAGIGGANRIETRIDRILRGDGLTPMSSGRAALLAVGCAGAIILGGACQRQVPPLVPDPEVTARQEFRATRQARWKAAVNMTADQVTALEAEAATNPNDLEAIERLLWFYAQSGQKVLGWNEMIERRRPHLLRLFERHPESELASRSIMEKHDPEGYQRARAIWIAHVSRPDASATVLGHAAEFFRVSEKPVSEALLLRAIALEPNGPLPRIVGDTFYPPWVSRLGSLYGQAIVGANDDTLGNVVKGYSAAGATGPYAQSVRAKLEAATDARLLLATGSYLMNNVSSVKDVGFDPVALGRTYVARALELDPDLPLARMSLVLDGQRSVAVQAHALARRARAEVTDPADELSEMDRFELLAAAADDLQRVSPDLEVDPERFQRSRVRARQYAEQAIALAEKLSAHPDRGTVLFRAHVTLGLMAMQDGDRKTAVAYLRSASVAPVSQGLEWTPIGDHALSLVNRLLAAGERESIAAFYDRLAAITRVPDLREAYTKYAQSIREGRMTWSYQATYGRS